MWSKTILCLLVSLVYASENPAWNEQSHYVYQVRGRSFAGLNQISNDYSGVVFKAQLDVQPKKDGNLGAKISNAQYAKVHAELSDGWETYIPDSQLNYQNLPLSELPFQINLNKGAVRTVVVNKQLKNWEANMLKSIVSQLQLDTKATNRIPSSINILTQEDSNTAVFKTMEETVTGVSETLYEIHPYPEYVLQSEPWMVPNKQLIEEGDVIEVVKNKNFTHSQQTPSYHAGLEGISGYYPGNKIGNFLSRTSVSQAIITGSLEQFTIQGSVTVEEIILSPTLGDHQKGSVNSKLNLTLYHVSQSSDENQYEVDNPVEVGLVYAYDSPFSTDNSPRPAKEYDHGIAPTSAESEDRPFRSRRTPIHRISSSDYSYDEDWHQDMPQLSEAPPSPLLPFTVGYDGQSIKKQQNIIETVRKLAEEIGQDFPHPKKVRQQHTLGKFVTLASLVRIMDQSEVEQVASQLYSPEKPIAWTVYRDAVAQAGTGPAIYNIKNWIQQKQLNDSEAVEVFSVAIDAARQPTEEYMKVLNGMMQDQNLMKRPYLNTTIILSYTNLVRQVYVNQQESQGKYPVHSYGSFWTNRGQDYVKKDIIPYLSRQLNEAISKADTQKIHVYIRALGNIGHQAILEAFETYLEGQRKASHFQRFLMVVALDQLVKNNPRVARSVLYKIYQNPSEVEQVRTAAVYQLMRTKPSPALLQRMASYTNVDTSNYVNAAVKSSIESASHLEASEHYELRTAAESARPLLTSQEYGLQYSQGYLRSYVVDESELAYQQYVRTFGGEDHAIPKGIKYTLQKQFGGFSHYVLNAHAMVSSVEDLINVYQQQTKEYQRQEQEKQQQQESSQYPWSSEYVAKILNLDNEQREQLEGNLYFHVGALQAIFSFDNLTIENLAEEVQKWENDLNNGKYYHCSKMLIGQEFSLAFPTALGLPFIYTYDLPMLINYKADIKASAKPPISVGDALQKPDTIEAEFDIDAVFAGRVQTEFGIFTPFDHQRYSAGYHKNFQLVLPLSGKLEVDIQKHQLALEMQNPAGQESVQLAHYSSWPYTAQNDIYTPKPNLKIIHSENPYRRNIVVGDKFTGVGVYLQTTSDHLLDPTSVYEKLRHHDVVSALLTSWPDENIQYVHVDVGIDAAKSTTQQVILRLGYQTDYQQNDPTEPKPDPNEPIPDIPAFAEDPEKRQNEFVDKLGSHINNAEVMVGDATIEFQGQNRIKYSLTAGVAKSNVDPQSRFMALVKKVAAQDSPTTAYIQAVSIVPNTNGLDLNYAMQMDPTSVIYLQGLLMHEQRLSRAEAQFDLSKSDERVEYLQQQDDYKECKHQMQQGNAQLPVCAKVTSRANLLDKFSIKMKYSNMDSQVINATYKIYSELRHQLYPRFEENILHQVIDRFDIKGQFSPDLEYVNASVSSAYGRAELRNAPIDPWVQQLLVPHPVFHTKARLTGEALKYDTYRPICVVDKTQTSTFDNKTYPGSLPNSWTVLLQYVPRRPSSLPSQPDQSVPEQLHQTTESYVVFAKSTQEGSPEKEIQIVLQMPTTQGKIVKVAMKPSRQGQGPKVLVNDQEVKYDSQSSSDFYDGNIQVYALPNKEVKVEVRQALYFIFNGQTLKITAVNSKFRDSSRGLCGTFTGEPETDFLAPNNCIIHDPQDFVRSYIVESQSKSLPMRRNVRNDKCYQKKPVHADYISNQDAGRSSDYNRRDADDCTGHLTRYEEKDGEICFTVRALPFCKSGCKPLQMISKPVDVHCLEASATTAFWRSQIDKGYNQDFTMMQPTQKLPMKIPSRCLP